MASTFTRKVLVLCIAYTIEQELVSKKIEKLMVFLIEQVIKKSIQVLLA